MEKKENKVPRIYLPRLEGNYYLLAQSLVREYTTYVFPTLKSFGLLDDEHIKKYLRARSWREVFEDIPKSKVELLEQLAVLQKIDIWKSFREIGTNETYTPTKNKDFIFAYLPLSGADDIERTKKLILECIVVANCSLSIDKERLHKFAVLELSKKQRDIYLLTSEFCENLRKLGARGLYANTLLRFVGNPKGGYLVPNIQGITSNYAAVEIQ